MKAGNPFSVTFGKKPPKYISRMESTDDIISAFTADPPVCQSYLICGIRGSGKTVLMTAVSKELAAEKDWIIVDLNSTQNLLDDFAMRLSDACKKIPSFLESGFDISFAGFGIGIGTNPQEKDSVGKIETLLEYIVKKGRKVLITIDEVMNGDNMRSFASQFQIFLRKDYPVYLIMTGLYENIYEIQNDPALTFLLRSPRIFLEPLSLTQITLQYEEIFSIPRDRAKKLADITKGYAFAFQALGLLYYEYSDGCTLEELLLKLDAMLDDYVYRKIWISLSERDREVVTAMLHKGKMKVKDVCEATGMTSQSFSRYRERLMRKGLILSPQRGFVELALPRFDEVIELYQE